LQPSHGNWTKLWWGGTKQAEQCQSEVEEYHSEQYTAWDKQCKEWADLKLDIPIACLSEYNPKCTFLWTWYVSIEYEYNLFDHQFIPFPWILWIWHINLSSWIFQIIRKLNCSIQTSTDLCTDPRPLSDCTSCYYLFM
jgi:hypothetical protein